MFDPANLFLFVTAVLILNLTPGPDMLFSIGQGLASGPRAGIVAAIGISTGALIHVCVAALGLAALMSAYPLAFDILRWMGILYLIYMAVQMIRSKDGAVRKGKARVNLLVVWRDAMIVNLLNPKVIVFILAFIPQFVEPDRGDAVAQFFALGTILIVLGTIVLVMAGGFAGIIGERLAQGGRFAAVMRWVGAGLMLMLAGQMAYER